MLTGQTVCCCTSLLDCSLAFISSVLLSGLSLCFLNTSCAPLHWMSFAFVCSFI
ncbi:hypothetical protein BU25DRAFT_240359 [Macroventuria anomochaeta]|uniref:Uncharacterized protein n=1 Tax=Macroventuria anomochaeta TaxID=301207 RepID=A0ACB6RK18_9PLEO|nr:uncharacterized protein BU25DRAFT_240359 [Macroventuria anomochaeta]KAF2621322.1 hypothetical protein BU25DRAFT_240359 [Macroventuria anomochaeta]